MVNHFDHQEIIATNLRLFIREEGYSRLSFSKVTGVPRTAVDQLLSGINNNVSEYNALIERIVLRFSLPNDYFLKEIATPKPPAVKLSSEAQKLMDGLENILDIYSMYLD
ncbi:hypothetical protein [Paenibacillus sp. FSL E2-0190]|uniref:hypothetical protein n=1 Tax=Paenibacillus sp. FSL E2-0190 TaxID=2954504 RepID=UPI0030ECFC9D